MLYIDLIVDFQVLTRRISRGHLYWRKEPMTLSVQHLDAYLGTVEFHKVLACVIQQNGFSWPINLFLFIYLFIS